MGSVFTDHFPFSAFRVFSKIHSILPECFLNIKNENENENTLDKVRIRDFTLQGKKST
jgi:hypothetical protein